MTISRRQFIKAMAASALLNRCLPAGAGVVVNDAHSQLNETIVSSIEHVRKVGDIQSIVSDAAKRKARLAICGARHAGGGQQFATDSPLIDMTCMNRVVSFDQQKGLLTVQPGIRWPQVLAFLETSQQHSEKPWGISQKQTGNDELTVGGAVCANAHGQGLQLAPFVSDVERFDIVTSSGDLIMCSRNANPELFKLVLGGYGNFGAIVSVTVRLVPRTKYVRHIEHLDVSEIPARFDKAVASGCRYGDWQCNIDATSDSFMRDGLFSSYEPVSSDTPIDTILPMPPAQWLSLVELAHQDKAAAFKIFSDRLLMLSGKVNWPETWQSSCYVLNYHDVIDKALKAPAKGTEVLSEFYVPISDVSKFVADVRADFIKNKVNLIYSTIRFINTDEETFLSWARQPSACVIFNPHVDHTDEGKRTVARTMQRLTDIALKYGGRYYLTYHRFARKDQVFAAYPEMPEFVLLKRKYDPPTVFCSDWFAYYEKMFS